MHRLHPTPLAGEGCSERLSVKVNCPKEVSTRVGEGKKLDKSKGCLSTIFKTKPDAKTVEKENAVKGDVSEEQIEAD